MSTEKPPETHTPGPWKWILNEDSKVVELQGGDPKFDSCVMRFARYGMAGAAPSFRAVNEKYMDRHCRAEEFGAVLPGEAHHAHFRKGINHPDARLIASAPQLLEDRDKLAEAAMVLVHALAYTLLTEKDEAAQKQILEIVRRMKAEGKP